MKTTGVVVYAVLMLMYVIQPAASATPTWVTGAIEMPEAGTHQLTYYMYDESGRKTGSMVTEFRTENGEYVFADVSKFDDGSVHEEATFRFGGSPLRTTSVFIDMKASGQHVVIDLALDGDYVRGTYITSTNTHDIDQAMEFDVVRAELYALLQCSHSVADIDTTLRVLSPLSMRVVEAELRAVGTETVECRGESVEAVKLLLDGKGGIPTNHIYIDPASRLAVRYEVITPIRLDIILQ